MYFEKISELDKGNMIQILDSFPEQCRKALDIADDFEIPREILEREYDKILVFGMGGSGIAGYVLRDFLLSKCKIPVFVVQGYDIPKFINENTLCFALSYSGNTEETLSCFGKAELVDAKIISITSGGLLSQKSKNKILIPKGIPPRTGLGYLLIPMIVVLNKTGIAKGALEETEEMISSLEKELKGIKLNAQKNTDKLFGKIPVIYGTEGFDSVSLRFRTQINENAKTFSHNNVFPELNHNESVGYKPQEKNLVFVLLRDSEENPQVRKRIEVTKKMLSSHSSVLEIKSSGKGKLARMFSLILAGDYTSYYLGLLNNVDPMPVENIEFLKKEIKEKN
ncbi:MAG: bifunctional phosphoglucose/phosphomannose isomerase [Candidatus Diapherotrites archaeon]